MRTGLAALLMFGTMGLGSSHAADDRPFAPLRLDATQLKVPVPQAALDRQFRVLSRMPGVEVEYSRFGSITRLKGHTKLFISPLGRAMENDQPANEIFARLSPLLVAKGTEMLVFHSGIGLRGPERFWRFYLGQTIRGRTVMFTGRQVVIDSWSGEIVETQLIFIPDYGLPAQPKISAEQAMRVAAEAVESPRQAAKGTVDTLAPELMYYRSHRQSDPTVLVWRVLTHYRPQGEDPNDGSTTILVDAIAGWSLESLPSEINVLKP